LSAAPITLEKRRRTTRKQLLKEVKISLSNPLPEKVLNMTKLGNTRVYCFSNISNIPNILEIRKIRESLTLGSCLEAMP
jgi:hypothetical protein